MHLYKVVVLSSLRLLISERVRNSGAFFKTANKRISALFL